MQTTHAIQHKNKTNNPMEKKCGGDLNLDISPKKTWKGTHRH